MELQVFRPKVPEPETLYFHVLKTYDLLPDYKRNFADPAVLNRIVGKGMRVFGDGGMAFVDCFKLNDDVVVGKEYTASSREEVFVKTILMRGLLKAGADIKITGIVNGVDYIYEARIDNTGRREWHERIERSSFYSLRIPLRELEIHKVIENDLVILEVYDPYNSGFKKLTICFDWKILDDFSKRAQRILLYDGMLARLLRMHSLRANVVRLSTV